MIHLCVVGKRDKHFEITTTDVRDKRIEEPCREKPPLDDPFHIKEIFADTFILNPDDSDHPNPMVSR